MKTKHIEGTLKFQRGFWLVVTDDGKIYHLLCTGQDRKLEEGDRYSGMAQDLPGYSNNEWAGRIW